MLPRAHDAGRSRVQGTPEQRGRLQDRARGRGAREGGRDGGRRESSGGERQEHRTAAVGTAYGGKTADLGMEHEVRGRGCRHTQSVDPSEYPLGQSSGADHTFSPAQLGSVRVLMDLSGVRTVRVSGRRHALPPASTPDSRAWRLCRPVSSEANGEGGVGGRAECKCDRASYDARTGTVR